MQYEIYTLIQSLKYKFSIDISTGSSNKLFLIVKITLDIANSFQIEILLHIHVTYIKYILKYLSTAYMCVTCAHMQACLQVCDLVDVCMHVKAASIIIHPLC